MGRREVHVVIVPKTITVALLLLVSASMVLLLFYLSGKVYARPSYPASEVLFRLLSGERTIARDAVLAALMPVIANILVFVPWGFLMFLALDTPRRQRRQTYGLTFAAGLLFALALEIWQMFLPAPVTNPIDAVPNAFGALLGAAAAHFRKHAYVRFEH